MREDGLTDRFVPLPGGQSLRLGGDDHLGERLVIVRRVRRPRAHDVSPAVGPQGGRQIGETVARHERNSRQHVGHQFRDMLQ
ncbi:hypothetical protein F5972_27685 [Microbispora cellulosiformans]|uniref:Uncharacterized protein n=1 Tax=Microbispora cellulosiformans TaxID=2614688 RepID=A0A5J5JVE9_9ACTN|nr:hypothetical protein F5972_27685 [Microbispora cellulosiformans]